MFVLLRMDLGGIQRVVRNPRRVSGEILGWIWGYLMGVGGSLRVGFPLTLGCSRVDLGGLEGVGGLQRMSVGVLRVDFGVPGRGQSGGVGV